MPWADTYTPLGAIKGATGTFLRSTGYIQGRLASLHGAQDAIIVISGVHSEAL